MVDYLERLIFLIGKIDIISIVILFKWEFVYGDACEYANRHEWKYTVLNKPENMKRLVTDLEKFGIECTTIERIKEQLENLLDVPVDITIKSSESKSNGQIYRNISVNPQ